MEPWRFSAQGALLSVRVRVSAEGGEANRAVTELLARALKVPKGSVRVVSGATSRLKQIAVEGDPRRLAESLKAVAAASRGDDETDM